jgi:hypothetical protein
MRNWYLTTFTNDDKSQAYNFTDKRMVGIRSLYFERNKELNEEKIFEDILIGCCAEFAVKNFFLSQGFDCSSPDLLIHSLDKKTYSCDLLINNKYGVNVKTFSSTRKSFDNSWIVQRGHGVTDLMLTSGNDFICLTKTDFDTNRVAIFGVIPSYVLSTKGLFKEPKKESLKKSKSAIYLDDVYSLDDFERWSFLTGVIS